LPDLHGHPVLGARPGARRTAALLSPGTGGRFRRRRERSRRRRKRPRSTAPPKAPAEPRRAAPPVVRDPPVPSHGSGAARPGTRGAASVSAPLLLLAHGDEQLGGGDRLGSPLGDRG